MDICELRIGNSVMDKETGRHIKLNRKLFEYGVCRWGAQHFDPIPLTPEMLEQMGFTYDTVSWFKDGISLGDYKGGIHLYNGSLNNKGIKVEFLHHLQNLYYDHTGKELLIEE